MSVKLPSPEHRVIEAREHHHIGGDGSPEEHQSFLIIEALVPMAALPYRFDTNEVRQVQVVEGGAAGEVYEVGGDISAVDITLDEPLEPGQRATVAYNTEFGYRVPPPPEFRRAVGAAGMEGLIMQVTFPPEKLPENIWWAQWDGYGPDARIVPGTEEPVELTPMSGKPGAVWDVWRQLDDVSSGVYGFRWEW